MQETKNVTDLLAAMAEEERILRRLTNPDLFCANLLMQHGEAVKRTIEASNKVAASSLKIKKLFS